MTDEPLPPGEDGLPFGLRGLSSPLAPPKESVEGQRGLAESIFDFVAELERHTDLAKLEARGTVRLALKQAGLEPRSVNREQMDVMLTRLMPGELKGRGVEDPDGVCRDLRTALRARCPGDASPDPESPEAIFRRLAQS